MHVYLLLVREDTVAVNARVCEATFASAIEIPAIGVDERSYQRTYLE